MNQIINFRNIHILLVALIPLLVLSGCNDDDDSPSDTDPETIDFGAMYVVLDETTGPGGVTLPALAGDSVLVRVGYSGCNGTHDFELRSRVLNKNRAEIWLYKVTADEDCEAYWMLNQSHRVPFEVLSRDEIYLVGPMFYTHQLR